MTELQKLILSLGNSSLEIADTLQKLGIKGERHNCRNCPIACFLLSKGFADVMVQPMISVPPTLTRVTERYWPESPVRLFIIDFDCGLFPLLEK